jgi:hypothetical protein
VKVVSVAKVLEGLALPLSLPLVDEAGAETSSKELAVSDI